MRPCAFCTSPATRRWQPPELAEFFVRVCAEHHASMAKERSEAMSALHRPRTLPEQGREIAQRSEGRFDK